MAKTVTKIPQTRNLFTTAPIATTARRKVAGYARVSTDSDEQFTSYEAQVDYYTQFIRSHADWDFVKVYTDEGISAVTTRHRDGFNEMIADALAGKIDLIVTKSVSRFARNTVDSLTTIRKLKEHGCECFFEKENIKNRGEAEQYKATASYQAIISREQFEAVQKERERLCNVETNGTERSRKHIRYKTTFSMGDFLTERVE